MKKRIVSMFLVLVMVLGMLPVGAIAAETVTEIRDQAGLAAMSSGSYKLTADITLENWTSLSTFSGTMDGNGHTITLCGNPLVETVQSGALIRNVIVNGTVTRSTTGNVGAIARSNKGTIRNCAVYADVTYTAGFSYCGAAGIAGVGNSGTISNCLYVGMVSYGNAPRYGSITNFEYSLNGTVTNCVGVGCERLATLEGWTDFTEADTGSTNIKIANAEDFVPEECVDTLNTQQQSGDLQWEVADGVLTLRVPEEVAEQEATEEEIAALTAAITAAEGLDMTKLYTADSYAAFASALEAAQALQSSEEKTQSAVAGATFDLSAAQEALAERSIDALDLSDQEVISITTADELEYMQDGKYYRLDADITLGQYWFGYSNTMNSVLDGNGHTVTLGGKPLWSAIGPEGVVQNLGVKGSAQNSANDTGAFAKDCSGRIVNCWSQAAVTSAGQNGLIKNTGGFVANLKSGGAIVNSYVAGSISASGNVGDGRVGALAGTAEANTAVMKAYWLNTVSEQSVGAVSGTVSGCASKTDADFKDTANVLALLNSGRGTYGKEWTQSDSGYPHLGEAGNYTPPQPIELSFTAYEGYGEGTTSFTDLQGLILSLAEVLPDPDAETFDYVGRFAYPGYDGEVAWVPQYTADGQGDHKVLASEDGELMVQGAGYLEIVAFDKASWSGTQYETELTRFTVTVSNISAEEIRLIPTGEYVTVDAEGNYSVAGSGNVVINTEIKVDGVWKSAPSSLFTFTTEGDIFGVDSPCFYATQPGEITVTASGLDKTVTVTVTSTYVAVESIALNPSGTYQIHYRNANSATADKFLDMTLSHNAGTVTVLPENASYRGSWTLTSSDPTIADYSSEYMMAIVPYKAGTVTLTAASTDPMLTVPVTDTSTIVLEYRNPVSKVEVAEDTLRVKENETVDLPITFTGTDSEMEYVSEAGMVWSFSGDGEIEINRDTAVIEVTEGTAKNYVSNPAYQLTGVKEGTVSITGTPVDTTGDAQTVTFTVEVASGTPETPADNEQLVAQGISGAAAYVAAGKDSYVYGDEWAVFILTRTGNDLTDGQIDNYLASVAEAYTAPTNLETKPTTIARVILAVSVLGKNAADLNGIDFIEMLTNSADISSGGNEAMWALIALDSCAYEIPENAAWNRDALIAEVLKYQSEAGGFGWKSSSSVDVDTTAMAIQALAPYYGTTEAVTAAVDAALAYLQKEMDRNCDFGSSNATAQVLIALSVLEKDPLAEENGFVNSAARNLITALSSYACEDGGYRYLATDTKSNAMATNQTLQALEAYRRFAARENALFDLTDLVTTDYGSVLVIVENTTYSKVNGAPWEGTLVESWIELTKDSTMMSAVVDALAEAGYTQKGAENNYIEEVNGLAAFDGGTMSGWMGTLNDWFTDQGFGAFTVADETLADGDLIRIMYTMDWGADLGSNSIDNTSLKALSFNAGTLAPAFAEETLNYTLTVRDNITGVSVTPAAVNKNNKTHIQVGETEYKRTSAVPVEDGTVITVTVGEGDTATVYTVTVEVVETELLEARIEEIYQNTGDYLENLGTPTVNTLGGEWMVLGLARSGREVPAGYYDNVIAYVQENINDKQQLHRAKSTDNSRVILALTAIGKDITNVAGHNLLKGLSSMAYITKLTVNHPTYALLAFDSHDYVIPAGDVTREGLIEVILSAQLEDGGWVTSVSATESDVDTTAMVIQALAPYYETHADVKAAVDEALEMLSELQYDDGGFGSVDGACSESAAQVLVALTAMGIDPNMDQRFIKNGRTVVDALCDYYVEGGGFKHVADGKLDGMATEQGYYALASYFRMKNGQTSLYDMTDVTITVTEPEIHTHRFGQWMVKTEASASKQGEEVRMCACGASESRATEILENPFRDVTDGDYFYESVVWAAGNGITTGTAADMFTPAGDCTRGQIVTFLWRYAGSPEPETKTNPFADVKPEEYYYNAVLWAVENGITTGMSDTAFGPDVTCTRAHAVTFLWRMAGEPAAAATTAFADVSSNAYYYNAVIWAAERGITNGVSDTAFAPDQNCLRGQIVTMLYRFKDVPQGENPFTFAVRFTDGSEITFEICTDAETVGAALLEEGLIAGEDSAYGLYVTTVYGVELDWERDQKYWSFLVNGEYSMLGADSTQIEHGAVYTFAVA